MHKIRLWIWPGLAAVACLSALALWFETAAMEAELKSRAISDLRHNHGWVQVGVVGRDLSLSGLAPDEDSRAAAVSVARNVYGVRSVRDASVLLPEEKPYRLSAKKTENGIALGGFVPNEDTRAALMSAVTQLLPGIALSDQLKLARGAPADLVSFASYGLSAFPRLSTGAMEITDRTMQVSGKALNPDDHAAALAALASVPASAGEVNSVDITPASVTGAYSWSAERTAAHIIFDGYVPNTEVREAIVAQARSFAVDLEVQDKMRFATGTPDGMEWLSAVEAGLAVLTNMAEGSVTITDRTLGVTGEARDASSYRLIDDLLLHDLPEGVLLGTADIGMAQGANDEWSARLVGHDVELNGAVPSAAIKEDLLETAKLKFGRNRVTDYLIVSGDETEGFENAALVALQALSRLDDAEVRIANGMVSVRGAALSSASAADVERLLTDELPQGFSGQANISAVLDAGPDLKAEACQTELNDLAGTNTVLFQSGEASIQDHSFGFLDRVARIVQRCRQVRLEVAGHTDADGDEAQNLALSERRAMMVVEFMAAAGIDQNRLAAVGYGETRPLDSSGTEDAKAANRRIEFHVLE